MNPKIFFGDKAFEWLQNAFENRDGGMPNPLVDRMLRSLRADARYKNLVVKVELPTFYERKDFVIC